MAIFFLPAYYICDVSSPAEMQIADASQVSLQSYVEINWLWVSSAQSDERALPGEGTGEDKQDSVSLPSQVLLPSFQDPVLVNLHLESNASLCLPDTIGLLQQKSCLA